MHCYLKPRNMPAIKTHDPGSQTTEIVQHFLQVSCNTLTQGKSNIPRGVRWSHLAGFLAETCGIHCPISDTLQYRRHFRTERSIDQVFDAAFLDCDQKRVGEMRGVIHTTLSLSILRYARADWPSLAWLPLQMRPHSQHKHAKTNLANIRHFDLALVQ